MNYELRRSETSGTTGYFNVLPEGEPDPAIALAFLEERPHDGFLKRYLASILPDPQTPIFQELRAKFADSRLVSDFLSRYILACERNKTGSLQRRADLAWRGLIHGPIPESPLLVAFSAAELRSCAQGMAASRHILPKIAVRFKPLPAPEPIDQAAFLGLVLARLEQSGLLAGPEMRHEASLSPIALLRDWRLDVSSEFRGGCRLAGTLTAYGRGLSLVQARLSCLMEIVERASAFAFIEQGGKFRQKEVVWASCRDLAAKGERFLAPTLFGANADSESLELAWLPGADQDGIRILVPCQAAGLFVNLDEPDFCAGLGSTGLGAGATSGQAKLAALTEVIERDAHATTPLCRDDCFVPSSRDPLLQSLLDDYRSRGIFLQMQDITTEIGVPCYRSFVIDRAGSIFQATAADLCGKKAALAAITETPWPYSWATGLPSPTGAGWPDLPVRVIEELPDLSLPGHANSLALLEQALKAMDRRPVYVELTRPDLDLPVYRAFIPGLEFDAELEAGPSLRLTARYMEKCRE